MKITVTRQDIQQGQRRDPEQCAVARALLRAGLEHAGVMGPSVMMSDGWGRLISLPLPAAVSDWIFDFDAGKPVRPIAFEMNFDPKRGMKDAKSVTASRPASKSQPIQLLSPHDLDSIERLCCGSLCKPPSLASPSPRKAKRSSRNRLELNLAAQ